MSLHLVLDHEDLVNLVRGVSPPYAVFNHPLVKSHFEYRDHPQSEHWHGLDKLSDVHLWTLYLVCKQGK